MSLAFGALAVLAIYLSSRAPTDEARAADLGRGVIVSIVLTIALAWVQHEGEVRAAKDSLEFSLASGRDFPGINLSGRDLRGFYLAGKNFKDADFAGADLRGAVLRGANVSGANFEGANLTDADLQGVEAGGSATRFGRANLHGADLTRAVLRSSQLTHADLREATLTGANLRGSDLRDANLGRALLAGAHLDRALLTNADFRGAVLSADLRHATMDGAAVRNIKSDSSTRWPPKSNPPRPAARLAPLAIPAAAKQDVVRRIVDGDTIVLAGLGGVRLLGIDAPQREARPTECFANESTQMVNEMLTAGESVRFTLGNVPRDIYGRAQAYVWRSDGTFVNEEILEQGAARVLISEPNVTYADRLRASAVHAADEARGLWSVC